MSQSPKIMSHLNTEVFPSIKFSCNVFFTIREMIIKLDMRLFHIQIGYFKIALKLPGWLVQDEVWRAFAIHSLPVPSFGTLFPHQLGYVPLHALLPCGFLPSFTP